jgi:hypothetical protein
MKHYLAAAAATLCLAATCLPAPICSGEEQEPIDKYYRARRADAYAMYQQFLEAAEQERQRKVREKLPPLTAEEVEEGKSVIRLLVCNKVMFWVICTETTDRAQPFEVFSKTVEDCASRKNAAMTKFWKLLDYAKVIGDQRFARCEIKARDFRRETRFPPFDFLSDQGLKILDFEVMNDCMTSGL